jgi:hypothetical protein
LLDAEMARTKRRAELQAVIAKLAGDTPMSAVGVADPASSALSTYLAVLFRVQIPTSVLAEWLVLVPVLALELGASLAAVLVQAVSAELKRSERPAIGQNGAMVSLEQSDVTGQSDNGPLKARGRRPRCPEQRAAPAKSRPVGPKVAAQARILDELRARGGRLEAASVRTVATLVGGSRTTVHAALGILLAAGAVARTGKALVLA